MNVLFDNRLANHAGLGRYGSDLIIALIKEFPSHYFSILVPPNCNIPLGDNSKNYKLIYTRSERYTISELLELSFKCNKFHQNIFHSTNYVLPLYAPIPSIVTIHDVMRLRLPEYCHSNEEFIHRFGIRRFINLVIIALILKKGSSVKKRQDDYFKSTPITNTKLEFRGKQLESVLKLHHFYLYLIHNRAITKSSAIITSSYFSKKEIIDLLQVEREKVHVIYPGVSSSFYIVYDKCKISEVLAKYSIPNDYYIHVGLKRRHKNVYTFINAYRDLLNLNSNIPIIVLVGPIDEDSNSLQAYINKIGLSSRVIFVGNVTDEELNCLYNGALATVVSSHYEGFGFPVLESMACGSPVIASDIPSISEVSNNSALLIDPFNSEDWTKALQKISNDKSLRSKLSQLGLENVTRFNWCNPASKILNVYKYVNQEMKF